jgi:cysteine desulfurase/selenocysteine lyase
MDTAYIRKDFPQYQGDKQTAYLDTAATSLTPEPVLTAVNQYYRDYRASVHRGSYKSAERATEAYEAARKRVAEFIGAEKSCEVIFTLGATASANMLIYALERTMNLEQGDEIVTSVMEHHAILLPLIELAKRKGLNMRYARLTKDFALDTEELEELITDRTKIVSIMVASNVTGRINKLPSSLLRRRSDVEAPVIIRDATAAVGHMPIDVQELGADFIFFSGHKMCGPTGVGVLYGRNELLEKLEPGCVGGGMVTDVEGMDTTWAEGPGRFEPGTQNIAGVLGIAAAAEYLDAVGLEVIRTHAQALVAYAQTLLGELPGVTLYSAPSQHNVGIISFTVEGIHPHDVAEVAGMEGVALRAGHHCALPLHKTLGVEATTRASVYLYNTRDDIDALVASVKEAQKVFKK